MRCNAQDWGSLAGPTGSKPIFVLALGLGYAALFGLYLPEPLALILGFIPGILAVYSLTSVNIPRQALYLDWAALSRQGGLILLGVTALMTPVVLTGMQQAGWQGWDWVQGLVYAPASGIAQELYFRAGLLPALQHLSRWSPKKALMTTSLAFAFFHIGMLRVAPPGAVLAALVVTGLAGLGWGWQTQQDRTVIWAMGHHALLQAMLRLFAWG